MSYRENTHKILSSIIQRQPNIDLIERYIWEYSKGNEQQYNDLLYQVLGNLTIDGEKVTKQKIQNLLMEMYNSTLYWDSPVYNTFRDDQNEEDHFVQNPFTVDEGVLQCFKCNSKRTFSFQKQTRSADEGATTFAQCAQCGHKWVHGN